MKRLCTTYKHLNICMTFVSKATLLLKRLGTFWPGYIIEETNYRVFLASPPLTPATTKGTHRQTGCPKIQVTRVQKTL